MVNNLYNSDYDAWVTEQIRQLQFKALQKLDIDHLITETKLPWETFPNDCPFSIDEILTSDFLPEH